MDLDLLTQAIQDSNPPTSPFDAIDSSADPAKQNVVFIRGFLYKNAGLRLEGNRTFSPEELASVLCYRFPSGGIIFLETFLTVFDNVMERNTSLFPSELHQRLTAKAGKWTLLSLHHSKSPSFLPQLTFWYRLFYFSWPSRHMYGTPALKNACLLLHLQAIIPGTTYQLKLAFNVSHIRSFIDLHCGYDPSSSLPAHFDFLGDIGSNPRLLVRPVTSTELAALISDALLSPDSDVRAELFKLLFSYSEDMLSVIVAALKLLPSSKLGRCVYQLTKQAPVNEIHGEVKSKLARLAKLLLTAADLEKKSHQVCSSSLLYHVYFAPTFALMIPLKKLST
jgi:hypothetical protein